MPRLQRLFRRLFTFVSVTLMERPNVGGNYNKNCVICQTSRFSNSITPMTEMSIARTPVRNLFFILFATLVLALPCRAEDNASQNSIPWKGSMLIGNRLTLTDSKVYQVICFSSNGYCDVTIGEWNCAYCCPDMTWKIDKDGVLGVYDKGKLNYRLELIRDDGEFLHVLLNGEHRILTRSCNSLASSPTSVSHVSTYSGPVSPRVQMTLKIMISVILGLWLFSQVVALNIIIYYAAYRCIADMRQRRKMKSDKVAP